MKTTRRQFAVSALTGLAATGCVSNRQAGGGGGAAVVATPRAQKIANSFLLNDKVENIVDVNGNAMLDADERYLWINFYGLVALVCRRAQKKAEVLCVKSAHHETRLWHNDGGVSKEERIEGNVTVSGLSSDALTFGTTWLASPWRDLTTVLGDDGLFPAQYQKDLGIALTKKATYDGDANVVARFPVEYGELFAGPPWASLGSRCVFRTRAFPGNDEAQAAVDVAGATDLWLTDNFSWRVRLTGDVKVSWDGGSISPRHQNGVVRLMVTSDAAGHTTPSEYVKDCWDYYPLLGLKKADQDAALPVFVRGTYGEKNLTDVWLSGSDPECPTFRIEA